ncbi:MAG: FHA domain-containing protein [Gemmataceae bacterium]
MKRITLQVLEGVDRGRVFTDLQLPVSIGREEGNVVRLNDERVSRFHAKIQEDNGDIILTDLDSTNGTRVNGHEVQIRRLRPGDCIYVGRTMLLFGSDEEIAQRITRIREKIGRARSPQRADPNEGKTQVGPVNAVGRPASEAEEFELFLEYTGQMSDSGEYIAQRWVPPLPKQLSPSQVARLAELLDFVHAVLARATESIQANEEATLVTIPFAMWQRILQAQAILAGYYRALTHPHEAPE